MRPISPVFAVKPSGAAPALGDLTGDNQPDDAAQIGNKFIQALTAGDLKTQQRLATPDALTAFRTWETGNAAGHWFSVSTCIIDEVQPQCHVIASYGQAPDTGIIFRLIFSDPSDPPTRIIDVTAEGDAG